MERKKLRLFCLALLGFFSAAAFSQAADSPFQNYGEIKPSEEATRIFESYKVLPHYKYYISGADLYPDAIIGIDKTFTLDTELWKGIELTPGKLKAIVTDMKSKGLEVGDLVHGFDILDNQGKKIGIWYSILRARTSLKMLGDNRVMIYTPPLDVWEKRQERIFPVRPH
jgi:hypothetical protein